MPLNHFQGGKSIPLVEGNRLRLGVHDDADTAEGAGHCPRHDEDCLEEGGPDSAPLCLFVPRPTREPKDGERIARKAPCFAGGMSRISTCAADTVANPTRSPASSAT